ncbi:homeobox protein knotted-1-like 2 isoform X2 [Punica granatum]|uniref:Homeobox protein knotted-1-like 2 isoform X2 n=1 Tax=Punica granatum TaxID=22663 RepID=A0A218XQF1_PUNGR|nr:homeobox protein knotted-1-like 2 isoform X2 [Punica granatum]OWM86751.1 hypothetical protein CDL15_Pgr015787 [Punica granatum]
MAFHNHQLTAQDLSSLHHFSDHPETPTSASAADPHHPAPNWLNSALLRAQQTPHSAAQFSPSAPAPAPADGSSNFLNLHTAAATGDSTPTHPHPHHQWLSRHQSLQGVPAPADSIVSGGGAEHPSSDNTKSEGAAAGVESGGGGGAGAAAEGPVNWQNARYKAEILGHPLYGQLLSAHVACLRIATPVDQLPRIDAQLAQSQQVVAKYSGLGGAGQGMVSDDEELDQFMTHYVLLLCSFKEQLQQHVRVHAMEAVMACWEIEQSLQSLTGVSPGEGTGATMSDDEDDPVDSDTNLFDGSLDGTDSLGFGPLIPTESERSLMERVRQELKHELKQGYKEKIVDIREEILRKRRAGKLPGDTTSVLKSWWQTHSKWPYPTEEDKARLVQETGLQLKQINNWFINQRKRNWHSNPSSSTVMKSKRKR